MIALKSIYTARKPQYVWFMYKLKILVVLGFVFTLVNCGIRGAPIPPKDPEIYYDNYQSDVIKKEKENEQKSKFRRGYSPSDAIQK